MSPRAGAEVEALALRRSAARRSGGVPVQIQHCEPGRQTTCKRGEEHGHSGCRARPALPRQFVKRAGDLQEKLAFRPAGELSGLAAASLRLDHKGTVSHRDLIAIRRRQADTHICSQWMLRPFHSFPGVSWR
jgi:hypothetical protein